MATLVETLRVAALANPVREWRWNCTRLGEVAFRRAVALAKPISEHVGAQGSQARHVGRVAHLIQTGWTDAIELEFPVPGWRYDHASWLITDGNHRMAAALIRGDAQVLVSVFGHLKSAAEMLGVSERRLIERRLGIAKAAGEAP